jgi:hypothetical protein
MRRQPRARAGTHNGLMTGLPRKATVFRKAIAKARRQV